MADNVIVRVPEQQFIRGEDGRDGASAYEQAVAGGYTGTEAQFNEELASFKELSEQAADSANTAAGAAFRAQNYERHAGDAEGAARAYADIALIRMNSADQSAQSAAGSASNASRDAGTASTAATTATTKAGEASDSATAADGSAKDAEAYAIGKRGGTDVGSTDPAYHNNSKYYAEQAALIVDDVEQVMTSTAVGPASIVTFDASVADMPLKGLTVNIEPVQSGSGDPSPENVRSITGWTGCNIYRSGEDMSNPTAYAITFPTSAGTVYGGTLDVTSKKLTVDTVYRVLDGNFSAWSGFAETGGVKRVLSYAQPSFSGNTVYMCDSLKPIAGTPAVVDRISLSADGRYLLSASWLQNFTTANEVKAYLTEHPVTLVIKKTTADIYSLSGVPEITTLLGTNNIWADCGDVTVTYGAYLETVKAYADQAADSAAAAEDAQEAAEAVLESIPSDYTELSGDVDDLKSAVDAVSMFEEYLPEKFEDTRFNRKVTIRRNTITVEKTGSDSTSFCHYSLFGHKYLGTGGSVPTDLLTDEDFISFTPYADAFILQRFTTFVSSNAATAYYLVTKNPDTNEIKSVIALNSGLGTSRTANMFEILPDIISNGNFGIVFTSRHNLQNITENFWIRTTMRTSLANITGNILATYKANKAYAIGDVLIVAGLLYRVTAAIANGAQLIPNTNIVKTTVADLIKLSNS